MMTRTAGASSAPSSPPSAASRLLHPVDTAKSAAGQVPGASTVKGAFDNVLDKVGVVSPRARRIAAYTGAGMLGVAGVVEWPVAAAGAAAVWLTQPRPKTEAKEVAATRKQTTVRAARTRRTAKPAPTKPSAAKPAVHSARAARGSRATPTPAEVAQTSAARHGGEPPQPGGAPPSPPAG